VNAFARNDVGKRIRVDRRVDGRVGVRLDEVRENALGSAALIEIVVNECDAQGYCARRRGITTAMEYRCKYVFATR
jgi:hypothetical protein